MAAVQAAFLLLIDLELSIELSFWSAYVNIILHYLGAIVLIFWSLS